MTLAIFVILLMQPVVSVVPGDRFAWEQNGPSLAVIRLYRYEFEVDGQRQKDPLRDVQCFLAGQPPTGIECTAPLPVMIGQHAIRVRAIDHTVPSVDAVEGPWSPLFAYVMRPTPAAPQKIRIVKPKVGASR